MKTVLINGTGTIGEPLIGLLADFKDELGIDEVLFNKRTPLVDEISKVNSLCNRGAKLVCQNPTEFEKLGHKVSYSFQDALELADVVVDCTPAGLINLKEFYAPLMMAPTKVEKKRVFIAQGSEDGFGVPYAYQINDKALKKKQPRTIQVVSCNTHNIACLVKSLASLDLMYSDFVLVRRANDLSQDDDFIASPKAGKHDSKTFGTHHASDASYLLNLADIDLPMFSTAIKVNSQYMHMIRFNIEVNKKITVENILELFKQNKLISLTLKSTANKIFSFGRDHGYYGRIFNQTVIYEPSLHVSETSSGSRIVGVAFTPQDGNSILSSVAATLYGLDPKSYEEKMKFFDKFLFQFI